MLKKDKTFKQNLIIAIIGVIGVIIGAIISITPQFYSANKNKIGVGIDKAKEVDNDHVKPVFKLTNKEDGYISSVISCLVEIAKLAQPSYLESQNNFKEDTLIKTKVRSTINHHLSKNLHISSIVQLENADCIVISTKLRITSDFDEEFKDEVFEVNNGVLIKRPDNFSFIEIEHYLNKIGAFIVNSNFNIHNDGEREVITTVRYFPKNSLTKEYVDVMGGGIYYPKKIQ